MYILGISAYQSDSSAALLKDGRLIGAIEEEKLVGIKHTGEFPVHSIQFLLEREGIKFSDIAHIAYFWKPFEGLHYRFWMILKHLPESANFYNSHGGRWTKIASVKQEIKKIFNVKNETFKFHTVNHHVSHAASSYFLSDFDEAAILTVDGSGEWKNTMMFLARGQDLKKIKDMTFPNSLGYLYASVTKYLGFKANSGEGKVMGLSSYGKPNYIHEFRKILKLKPQGEYELDLSYFDYYKNAASISNDKSWVSKKFIDVFGPPRVPESEITSYHEDIAASLQYVLNEVMLHIVNWLYETTKVNNICLAGGVALNSVANGYLLKNSGFKNIFIQPAAGDGGTSVGAAMYVHNSILKLPRVYQNECVFLGPEYDDQTILRELQTRKLSYTKVDPAKTGAQLLANGKIIGWFQGKVEFGPRALGHRSILADPRIAEMKDIINARVKHREHFRPFAPAILEEKLTEYFDHDHPSPVMLLVYNVKEEKRNIIPAVTHVDGTGRVQSVSEKESPLFYSLIKQFESLTKVPVILNTSLNIRGKPIATKPEHAIECFLSSDMDYLLMGNYLISKS